MLNIFTVEPKRWIYENNASIQQRRQTVRPSIRVVKLPSQDKLNRSTLNNIKSGKLMRKSFGRQISF